MKKALTKDFIREITGSLSRYLSILFIVALGVAFFSGIRATSPDMKMTLDYYLDKTEYMDIRIVSTMGLTDEDLKEAASLEGVLAAEGSKTYDAYVISGDEKRVLHFISKPFAIGLYELVSGRDIKNRNECVVDKYLVEKYGFSIGDRLKLTAPGEDEIGDYLDEDEFEIVGVISSSSYFTTNRDTTNIGNGTTDAFVYLDRSVFAADYYSSILMTVEGAAGEMAFSDKYDDIVASVADLLESIKEERERERYDEIMEDAHIKIEEAESELEEAKYEAESELSEAEEKIADAENEISDGWNELEDNRKTYNDEIADAEKKISDGEKEISDGYEQLEDGEKKLSDGKKKIADGQKKIDSSAKELEAGKKEYEKGLKAANEGQSEIDKGYAKLDEGQSKLDQAAAEAEEGIIALDKTKRGLISQKNDLTKQLQELNNKKTELKTQKSDLKEQKNEIKSQIDEVKLTIKGLKSQISSVLKQDDKLAGQIQEVTAQKNEIESQISMINKNIKDIKSQIVGLEEQKNSIESQIESAKESADKDAAETLKTGLKDIEDNLAKLEAGKAEAEAGLEKLEAGKKEAETGLEKLEAGKKETEAGLKKLNEGKAEAEAGLEQLQAGLEKIEKGIAEIDNGLKEELDPGIAKIKEGITAIDAALSDPESELNKGYAKLESGQAELEKNQAEIDKNRKELESGQAELDKSYEKLDEAKKKLEEGTEELKKGQKEIDKQNKVIKKSEKELEDARKELQKGENKLKDSKNTLEEKKAEAESKFADAESELYSAESELADAKTEYEDGKKEADEKIADAESEIADAKDELSKIKMPKWYILDRGKTGGYLEYGQNADRIGAIGRVFPLIFFLVAALISLTTMTRMVESQRVEIGTLKALGYSQTAIAGKYVLYALSASVIGSAIGIVAGQKFIPWLIISTYMIIYPNLPVILTPLSPLFSAMSAGAAIVCVTGAAYAACRSAFHESPAQLMRPQAPVAGKKILLEHITPLWRRFSFTRKVTLRNLFRYKKRFLMTIFGTGGCTALVVFGFGLTDSIGGVVGRQYEDLTHIDLTGSLKDDIAQDDLDELTHLLDSEKKVEDYIFLRQRLLEIDAGRVNYSAYLTVPEDTSAYESYFYLNDRETGEEYHIHDDSVIITEKLADLMSVGPGDMISFEENDQMVELPVEAVAENYLMSYVFMSPKLYESTFGETPEYNTLQVKAPSMTEDEMNSFSEDILELEAPSGTTTTAYTRSQFDTVINSLDIITLVVVTAAAMLALIVLYNLNNINITERRRELATIKVLGFYDIETAAYIFRENILLTIIGASLGLIFGKYLHSFIITTVETDIIMFIRHAKLLSYLKAFLLTFAFSMLVNVIMFFSVKKIDMIESLKSVE